MNRYIHKSFHNIPAWINISNIYKQLNDILMGCEWGSTSDRRGTQLLLISRLVRLSNLMKMLYIKQKQNIWENSFFM